MTSNSFQNEVPKARVNIRLDLHTGGAQKKVELPLKLMLIGDYSNGREQRTLSERSKVDINKNNFNQVLGEFHPELKLSVPNTLAGDGSDAAVALSFRDMKDFEPEQVARQIPELRALLAMRNLLRDLKSMPTSWLDDIAQKREGHEALEAFLDIFNHRIFTQFYRIWRKYSYPASFTPGGRDATSQCLLGLIGLGIPGTAKRIATPMSRFLALLGVMRLPTRNAEGVIALVKLLAPATGAKVTAHWPKKIMLIQPAKLSTTHPIRLGQGMPIGRSAMDVNCQLKLSLVTDDIQEAHAWLPGAQRHKDLLVLLQVYLGWRCTATLELRLPLHSLPRPVLGTQGLLLGMTAVIGAGKADDDRTVTINLGLYQGLKNNMKKRDIDYAPYRFT